MSAVILDFPVRAGTSPTSPTTEETNPRLNKYDGPLHEALMRVSTAADYVVLAHILRLWLAASDTRGGLSASEIATRYHDAFMCILWHLDDALPGREHREAAIADILSDLRALYATAPH